MTVLGVVLEKEVTRRCSESLSIRSSGSPLWGPKAKDESLRPFRLLKILDDRNPFLGLSGRTHDAKKRAYRLPLRHSVDLSGRTGRTLPTRVCVPDRLFTPLLFPLLATSLHTHRPWPVDGAPGHGESEVLADTTHPSMSPDPARVPNFPVTLR